MSYFDSVSLAPADPILSLTEAFKADANPDKINLSVGVFVDDNGVTPVLDTVKEAETRLLTNSKTKSYLPITGSPEYARLTQNLCFGSELAKQLRDQTVSLQTPGGTGALRVAADFIAKNLDTKTVWLSNPTWANHGGIFGSAGLQTESYTYFDNASLSLDYAAFIDAISKIPAGDVVVLHGCCHNPTGADLEPEQWEEVAKIAASKGWIPLVDFAYQGFGIDIDTDAAAARIIAKSGLPVFVCQSFSKNLGLYQDRVGALHVVTGDSAATEKVASQLKVSVRTNYSNPPAHGGGIVTTILSDETLTAKWHQEVAAMRGRIAGVRQQFVDALKAAGVSRDFSFLIKQKGMFSFTGLTKEQAMELREKHAIYIVNSGRINVAGITSANLERLVASLKSIIG
ncbi:amino acid aminotransferase [Pelagicoccus sp. SDUM812003]|uniref:amino acid aminotransferase n=1 Tax=Pelagicoccus sp. SDUM812003 TaxID=3041267 RepID=UPI00280ECD23|nr:amino acid aminotransferase [Pelagicoccus sp. SDUM812003]MDQ8202610.1 aspartate/tyrosine/aromatic aminotransferase [Pelagicoccus sp. SDUM812003]